MHIKSLYITPRFIFYPLFLVSAFLVSFSHLLVHDALIVWPVVFAGGVLALLSCRRQLTRPEMHEQFLSLLALQALIAVGFTQVIAANNLPSGLLPLHALPGREVIYIFLGAVAAFGLSWLSINYEEWATGGAALAAAGLYSSVIFFRVSAVVEVGYAYSVLTGFALLALLSMRNFAWRIPKEVAFFWKWLLAFISVLFVAVMVSPAPHQSITYILYVLVLVSLAALVSIKIQIHERWKLASWMIFALGASLPVALAVIKTISIVSEFGPTVAWAYRLHPTEMGGANLIARSILTVAPFGAALLLNGNLQGWVKWFERTLLALLQILILAVIIYSRSYEGFFAWLVALGVFVVLSWWDPIKAYWKRVTSRPILRVIHIGAGFVLIITILYAGFRIGYTVNPYSFNGRFAHWVGAFNAWQNHPLLGGGPDNEYLYTRYAGDLTVLGESQEFIDDPLYVIRYRAELLKVHAHNLFLETAAFSGLAGIVTAAGMLITLVWIGFQTWRQADLNLKILAAACLASIFGELAWGLLDVVRETPPFFSFPIWMVIGLLLAIYSWSQTGGDDRIELKLNPQNAWILGLALVAGLLIVFQPAISSNRYSTGFLAFQEHRWEDAARNFRTAAMIDPFSSQYYWMLSKAELEVGRLEQAEAALHRAVTLKRGYSPYLAQAGWLSWLRGDLEAAGRYFDEAIASDPLETWTSGLHANKGLLRVYQGWPTEANPYFVKSFEFHPELASAPYWVKSLLPDGSIQVVLSTDYSPGGQESSLNKRVLAHMGVSDISPKHFDQSIDGEQRLSLDDVLSIMHETYLAAKGSGDPNAHLILAAEAEASRLAGLDDRAESAYLEYQILRPKSAFGYRGLASVYSTKRDGFEKAQRLLEEAIEVSPKNIEVLRLLTLLQLDHQNVAAASDTLAMVTPIASKKSFQFRFFNVDLIKTMVQLYSANQDVAMTRRSLEWLAKIQSTPDDFLALAQHDKNNHQWNQAVEKCWHAYDLLIKTWVRPYDPRLWTAANCIAQSDQTDDQIEHRAEVSGSSFTSRLLLAHVARVRSQPDRAAEYYLLATQLRGDESAPHYYLGELSTTLNRFADAEREFDLAVKLDDRDSLPLLSLGKMYEDNGNFTLALEAYKSAIARAPGSEEAQLAIANFFIKTQNFQDAEQHLTRVQLINIQPTPYPRIDLISKMASASYSADTFTDGLIKGSICDLSGDRKVSIFMHPVSWAKYDLRLPDHEAGEDVWLDFYIGLLSDSWNQAGDGVNFKVSISSSSSNQQLFTVYMDPKKNFSDRHWEPVSINLNEYAGQNITLSFLTDGGDAGDIQYDWACWGRPVIVVQKQSP